MSENSDLKRIQRAMLRHEREGKKIQAAARANRQWHDKLKRRAEAAKAANNLKAMIPIHREWKKMLAENQRLVKREAAWMERSQQLFRESDALTGYPTVTFGLEIEPRFTASFTNDIAGKGR